MSRPVTGSFRCRARAPIVTPHVNRERHIDHYIDYFGGGGHAAPSSPPSRWPSLRTSPEGPGRGVSPKGVPGEPGGWQPDDVVVVESDRARQ